MNKIFLTILGVLAAIVAWVIVVFVGVSEGWTKSALTVSDSPADFVAASRKIVEAEHTGNLSMLVLQGGAVSESYNFSIGKPVDGTSVFQVASLSKWIAAWGVMALVEAGDIDLDRPVWDYITKWHLPDSEYDSSGVTVRRLLSHTAGLHDSLGYDGFEHAQDVQTLEASLSRALDASPGNDGIVKLGAEPGAEWKYSGGGFTLLQLLIEEVSGQSFADYMSEHVFTPLGLERTTFSHEEALIFGLAENFDTDSGTEPFRRYTALAATSLFTSTNDLALFILAQTVFGNQSVLSTELLTLMQLPHASQMGAEIWGLGLMLYAPNNQGGFIVGHDGKNGPAINTAARFNPATGDGIVILSTGSEGLATEIAGEWVFWKTGNIDSLMFLGSFNKMLLWMAAGSVLWLIIGLIQIILVGRRQRFLKRRAEPASNDHRQAI